MGITRYTIESMKKKGWTCIDMKEIPRHEQIGEWCRANCEWEDWVYMGYSYWFKDPQIAMLFKLKWA